MRRPCHAAGRARTSQCRSGNADAVAFVSDAVHAGAGHSTQAVAIMPLRAARLVRAIGLNGWFALLLSVYGTSS